MKVNLSTNISQPYIDLLKSSGQSDANYHYENVSKAPTNFVYEVNPLKKRNYYSMKIYNYKNYFLTKINIESGKL